MFSSQADAHRSGGTVVFPAYEWETFPEESHQNRMVTYRASSGTQTPMLGGGVWMHGSKNFLATSYPEMDPITGRCSWVAFGKDHGGLRSPEQMSIVAIGLKGVHATIMNETNDAEKAARWKVEWKSMG